MAMMLALIALMALSSELAPRLTPRDILFGVTIDPALHDSPIARLAARRYSVEIWLLSLAAAALVASSNAPSSSAAVLGAQGIGAAVAFAKARHTLLPYAAIPGTVREAEIAPRPSLPGGLIGQLGPFVLLIGAAVYVSLHWRDIPAHFATHWNIAGRPDAWSGKSIDRVYGKLWIGFVVCAISLGISWAVLHRTRLPRITGDIGREIQRGRWINLLVLLASEYLVAILISWSSIVPMLSATPEKQRLPFALLAAPFVLTIAAMLSLTRTRAILKTSGAHGRPLADTPDSAWVLGLIYFNRDDPAIFVEKRLGLGYTPNFGNIWAWLFLATAILGLSLPAVLGG